MSNVNIDIIISQYCKCNVTMQGHHYTVPYPAVFFLFFSFLFLWFCSLFFLLFISSLLYIIQVL